ncbi:MAG: DUF4743 domain-containing protein, partial [Casimicrobiaceae bacterium]
MEGAILTAILDRLGDALASPPFDPSALTPRIPWPQRAKDLRHGMHPLRVDGVSVGYVDAVRAVRLARFADVFRVRDGTIEFVARLDSADSRSVATADVARTLAAEGALTAWRDELYAVAETFGAPPAFLIERAAARYFGVRTWA